MGYFDGRVLEITRTSNDRTRIAYLYNFPVNSSRLSHKHQVWLFNNLAMPALSQVPIEQTYPAGYDPHGPMAHPWMPLPYKPPLSPRVPSVQKGNTTIITVDGGTLDANRLVVPDYWQIWLNGTTSRPGSREYNLSLSRSRADAVARYITTAPSMGSGSVSYNVDPHWSGEFLAEFSGKQEWREDPLDRAVLVAFRPVYPYAPIKLPPPARVLRPIFSRSCCSVKLEIEYLNIMRDAWGLTGARTAGTGASSRRTLDDGGDYPDSASVPYVSPDQTWLTNLLHSHGYSDERATWLKTSGKYSSVPLVSVPGPILGPVRGGAYPYRNLDASNVTSVISKDIEQLEQYGLAECTDSDPLDDCSSRGSFPYRKD